MGWRWGTLAALALVVGCTTAADEGASTDASSPLPSETSTSVTALEEASTVEELVSTTEGTTTSVATVDSGSPTTELSEPVEVSETFWTLENRMGVPSIDQYSPTLEHVKSTPYVRPEVTPLRHRSYSLGAEDYVGVDFDVDFCTPSPIETSSEALSALYQLPPSAAALSADPLTGQVFVLQAECGGAGTGNEWAVVLYTPDDEPRDLASGTDRDLAVDVRVSSVDGQFYVGVDFASSDEGPLGGWRVAAPEDGDWLNTGCGEEAVQSEMPPAGSLRGEQLVWPVVCDGKLSIQMYSAASETIEVISTDVPLHGGFDSQMIDDSHLAVLSLGPRLLGGPMHIVDASTGEEVSTIGDGVIAVCIAYPCLPAADD